MEKKTAIVTGAGKGIGKAIALSLSREGYFVILTGRNADTLKQTAAEISAAGGRSLVVPADVSRLEDVENLFSKTLQESPTIDVIINNAGLGYFNPVEEMPEHEYEQMFDINVKGSFLISKKAIPLMKEQQKGHIVMITSDVARRVFAGGSVYCASKHAQDALASAMRKELRPFGVKVTCIMPGLTDTYFGDTQAGTPEKQGWLKPEDIANATMFAINTPPHVLIDDILIHPMEQEIP